MMGWMLRLFQVIIDAPYCRLKAFLGIHLPGHSDLSQINVFNMLFCCLSSLLSIHSILPFFLLSPTSAMIAPATAPMMSTIPSTCQYVRRHDVNRPTANQIPAASPQ